MFNFFLIKFVKFLEFRSAGSVGLKSHLSLVKASGWGMKLIIDENVIAKKMKIKESFGKYMLHTSKESLEHLEFRFK